MRFPALLPFAAFTLLAGCTTGEPAAPAAGNTPAPLPEKQEQLGGSAAQSAQFTYWRKVPGTNLHEPYVTDRPLTRDEREKLGIVPPAHEAAQ